MSDEVYLTFPIALFKNGMNNLKGCLNDAMDYCVYYQWKRFYQSNPNADHKEQARKDIGIIFPDLESSLLSGKTLYDQLNSGPKCSLRKEMVFDFYKGQKTEFEVVCFLAYAAIKSIIQKQAYIKITNDYLLGRMSGNAGKGQMLNKKLLKYNKRYQLDKIKKNLVDHWNLKMYSNKNRGFYVSFKISLDELAYQAEKRKKAYLDKKRKMEKKKALESAMRKLSEFPV